jgi:mRNA-degrading endonuclease RelE of RelBE toxin-antitoxin system
VILEFTNSFKADYRDLPDHIQKQTDKALRLLVANPPHPSLRVKRIQGTPDVWEARVTLSYRLTFNWVGEVITIRRVGTHDILKKETK